MGVYKAEQHKPKSPNVLIQLLLFHEFIEHFIFVVISQIAAFPSYYLMQKLDHPVSAKEEAEMHTRNLQEEVRVSNIFFIIHQLIHQ